MSSNKLTASKMATMLEETLIPVFDYLDAPTLMQSREICKKWKDVVNGNRSLWTHFYLGEDSKVFSQTKFDLFAEKSGNRLVGVEIHQDIRQKRTNFRDVVFFETLLRSSDSLRHYWHVRQTGNSFIMNAKQLLELSSICYYGFVSKSPILTSDRRIELSPRSSLTARTAFTRLHFGMPIGDRLWNILEVYSPTLKQLSIWIRDFSPPKSKFQFPRLMILEITVSQNHRYAPRSRDLLEALQTPSLEVFSLSDQNNLSIPFGLSSSLKQLHLSYSTKLPYCIENLLNLKSVYPKLEVLRLDQGVTFDLKDMYELLRYRQGASRKGGMSGIKRLGIDTKKMSSFSQSQFKGLVEDLERTQFSGRVYKVKLGF